MTYTDMLSANGSDEFTTLPLDDNLRAALELLWHAYDCVQDAHAVRWDFALEIDKLYQAGLTITDLRWLVVKGFVEHGSETSKYGDAHRSFTRSEGLNFVAATCVVLTTKGAAFVSRVLQAAASPNTGEEPLEGNGQAEPGSEIPPAVEESEANATLKPHWDPVLRALSVGSILVKRFFVPAENQELILEAFEEEGWPEGIDDPLPGSHAIDPKVRLNDAIYRLNRTQTRPLIRFHTNGKGNGVHWSLWDLRLDANVHAPPRNRSRRRPEPSTCDRRAIDYCG